MKPTHTTGKILYLAPNGNDAWSGNLSAPNAARTDGPLATLARARDAVRSLNAAAGLPDGGVTVQIAAGVHELAQTLHFGPGDSGTADRPVRYVAAPGAAPVRRARFL